MTLKTKILIYLFGILAIGLIIFAPKVSSQALGASAFNVQQGGTGSTTLSGILNGNGLTGLNGAIKTLVIGSNLTFDGTTLSATGGSGTFPFTPFTSYNGTSTPIGFSAGLFTNGSTTITSVGSGFVQAVNGLLSAAALTGAQVITALGFTPAPFEFTPSTNYNSTSTPIGFLQGLFSVGSTTISTLGSGLVGANNGRLYGFASSSLFGYIPVQSVTASAPLFSSGGVNPNLTWFGLSTTSALTQSNLLYNTTAGNGVAGVATTSVTCSGNTTCTTFTAIGPSPITISSTGGGTGLSTTSPIANSNVLTYSSAGAGAAYGTATTTLAFSGPFTGASLLGALVGGSNSTVLWTGLATTSNLTQGQVLYNTTNGNGVASVGTSTPTVSAPITYSGTLGSFIGGIAGTFACTLATGSVTGCLSTTDWNTFNNKISSTSLSATFPLTYTSATGVFTNSFSTTTNTGMSAGNLYIGSGGIMQTAASSSIFGFIPEQVLTFVAPLIRTANSIAWTGLATTSQPASSNLLVSNGLAGVYGVATSAPTVAAPITYSGTLGAFVGGVGGSFGCTNASSGVTGCLTGTDWNTFNNKQATISTTWPIQLSGATLSFGWATTSQPSSSNLFVSNGSNGFYGVATTTASCAGTASCTAFTVIGSSPITITGSAGTSASSTLLADTNTWSGSENFLKGTGFGTSSPFARVSIHANPTDSTIYQSLFAIGSSTASATSTLFNVLNTGDVVLLAGTAGTPQLYSINSVTGTKTGLSLAGAKLQFTARDTLYFEIDDNSAGLVNYANIIGNQSGSNKIYAAGAGSATNPTYGFNLGSANTGIYSDLAQTLRFSTNGVHRMTLDSSGNFGIGTSTPFGKLAINLGSTDTAYPGNNAFIISSSTASATTTLFSISNTGSIFTQLGTGCVSATAGILSASGSCGGSGTYPFTPSVYGATPVSATSTALQLTGGLYASSTVRFGNAGISPFLFDGTTGNLGLGTTTPATLLEVQGDVSGGVSRFTRTNSATNAVVGVMKIRAQSSGQMSDGFGGAFQFYNQDADGVENGVADIRGIRDGADNSGALTFSTNSSGSVYEGFRLTTNSYVGIGSTSPFAKLSIHQGPLDVINTTLFAIGSSTASATTTLFSISNTGSIFTQLGTGCVSATAGVLSASGSCGGSGAYPFTPSTQFGLGTSATTTPLQLTAGFTASSTAWISNLVAGTTTGQTFLNAPIIAGINSNNYAQIAIQNLSTGNNASSLFAAHADIGTDSKYYTEFGINNSGYSQAAFSSQNPLDSFLVASDGALVIGTASTTNTLADIRFTVGGTASSSIKAIIKPTGNFGIASTSPYARLSIHANPVDSTASRSLFSIGSSTNSATTTLFTVRNSGFVGIGKAAPTDVLNVVGNVLVEDTSNSKSYRLRTTGGSLDFEASGAAMFYSVWSAAAFGGTQQNYLKLNASSQSAVGFGDWEFQTGNSGNGGTPTISIKSATNNVGVGSTSPFAKLSIHGNPTDLSLRTTLFAIGSSTATATTTLFSVSNIGQVNSNSSTSQLVLGDLTRSNQWHLRSIAGSFFLATSTFGGATSTLPALTILTTGAVGFGTSSPINGIASVAASTTAGTANDGYRGTINILAGWEGAIVKLFQVFDSWGRRITGGDAPVISSCGGSPSFTGSANDTTMSVLVGTATNACTVTFAHAWPTAPVCVVTNRDLNPSNPMTYTVSTTAIVLSQVTFAGAHVDIMCVGTQ